MSQSIVLVLANNVQTTGVGWDEVHAKASRHSALSYGYAGKIEKQLKK